MRNELKKRLERLAEQYETAGFLKGDPSQFLRRFTRREDQEVAAFTAACLALGRRDQILAKLELIFTAMRESPSQWVRSGAYCEMFPDSQKKFYRFFSYGDVRRFFGVFAHLPQTLGETCAAAYAKGVEPLETLTRLFADTRLVPNDTSSCCKRLALFLRWMVRDHSPVDLGLWTWYDKRNLMIPLDTHVLQQAHALHLVRSRSGSRAAALAITAAMRRIWPDDPCKGDYALFGLSVDPSSHIRGEHR